MHGRTLFAVILAACLLAAGFGGLSSTANAASAGQSMPNPGNSIGGKAIGINGDGHEYGYGPRIYAPIGPTYRAYDYPYYLSRGYYPHHIGQGYVYYGPSDSYDGDEDAPKVRDECGGKGHGDCDDD